MEKVRVRFAPSPTGHLHIGGFRTALFNYLFARRNGGTFVLRIEDTDRARSTEDSIQQILDGMKWVGLDWDEGPIRQTDRTDIYMEKVESLLASGRAYKCTCSQEVLDEKRKAAMASGQKPKYDGTCRGKTDVPEGTPYVVRFICPQTGETVFKDLIRGIVTVHNSELDDLIILRTDGTPTYNFCVVIDDATMNITHVIRGDDHISNTPRQVQIYKALDYPVPEFAHLPMILGEDKARLSKRHGATSILEYQNLGFLPEAMINYFARMGWSHGDQELFSKEELISLFSLENVSKSAGVFNQEKFQWVNAQHIKKAEPLQLASSLRPFIEKEEYTCDPSLTDETIANGLDALQDRSKTLVEMAKGAEFYLTDAVRFDEKAVNKFLKEAAKPLLQRVLELVQDAESLDHDSVEKIFAQVVEEKEIKLGKIAQPVRVALTGTTVSPGIFDVIRILGKERTTQRLATAIEKIPT